MTTAKTSFEFRVDIVLIRRQSRSPLYDLARWKCEELSEQLQEFARRSYTRRFQDVKLAKIYIDEIIARNEILLVQETTDKVVLIKEKLKAARDRQKSYADNSHKPLEFEVGNRELLKVTSVALGLDNQSIERVRLNAIGFVLDFVEFISFTFGDKEMILVIEAVLITGAVSIADNTGISTSTVDYLCFPSDVSARGGMDGWKGVGWRGRGWTENIVEKRESGKCGSDMWVGIRERVCGMIGGGRNGGIFGNRWDNEYGLELGMGMVCNRYLSIDYDFIIEFDL
ncbi:hypothetical protein Tco_1016805 [Tanacetum coccineum]|uniref:Reverse transcriptase domain-containing protein n=1 Tax=Tanacetum coccineum TaxID=301880 RepID=A0ABQ5FQW3_9ASTR